MLEEVDLRLAAREIFDVALDSVDAHTAVRRAMRLEGSRLTIVERTFELDERRGGVYALAIGKAAFPMAVALDEILGEKLTNGFIVGTFLQDYYAGLFGTHEKSVNPWRSCEASHPLPTESSLHAARISFELLQHANEERAPVIFLISGGGSAMIEWPSDEQITLADLRMANRALVSCGASIAEINAVRRAFSAVKGGGLAARAPLADQVSLIISDTGKGHESIVASGLTCPPPFAAPDAASVIARYKLEERLPAAVLHAVKHPKEQHREIHVDRLRERYVLLDNESAIKAAASEARRRGFITEVAPDISEQPIEEGCALMLSRLAELRRRADDAHKIVCLISGGEFSCPVRGDGVGGRNSETTLRCVLEMDERLGRDAVEPGFTRIAILSAGTDGIDGNSPAAGAIACETTLSRAREMKLDVRVFLERSDAFTFFSALGDAISTGATGTNVRDLRLLLAI